MLNREQMIEDILNKVYPDVMIHTIEVDGKISYAPISLSRVLSTLDYKYKIIPLHDNIEYNYYIDIGKEKSIKRKLLNENGSDAYLDNQDEDTIRAIHGLLSE